MKKRIVLATLLVIALMAMTTPVYAWDVEDPVVAANEDFIGGAGYDDGVLETQSGAQDWPPGKNPNEGYSLYRDDVTDTGNLDQVYFLTFTPDVIDLPIITSYGPYPKEGIDEYWYMGGEVSPDTWYLALKPRGHDLPPPPPPAPVEPPIQSFILYVQGGNESYPFLKTDPNDVWTVTDMLSCNVSQEGMLGRVLHRIDIPEGTSAPTWLDLRMIDGEIYFSPQCDFSQPVTLSRMTDMGWEEVATFTKIRSGKALP